MSNALPSRDEGSLGPAESAFEESVADALRAKGWEVRPQIGVSGFRVDLGVMHPSAGSYLAGIECDGARYHSSATARDRDKVRQAVLEGLGWKILRVWSTDWFRNPLIVADRLHGQLKKLLEADREARKKEDEAEEQTTEANPVTPQVKVAADPGRFFDPEYAPVLRRLIHGIVVREGPVTLNGLARRVAQEHGWQRTGKRIRAQVQKNLGSVERHSEFETVFVWAPGSHSDRVPFRGLKDRPIRDISRTEVASVIDAHGSDLAKEDDPILALSRLLRISRLSKDARACLSDCARWREENTADGPTGAETHDITAPGEV